MSTGRDVRNPLVSTYIRTSTSRSGEPLVHVRIMSLRHNLDRRGTGPTLATAAKRARAGLLPPR